MLKMVSGAPPTLPLGDATCVKFQAVFDIFPNMKNLHIPTKEVSAISKLLHPYVTTGGAPSLVVSVFWCSNAIYHDIIKLGQNSSIMGNVF